MSSSASASSSSTSSSASSTTAASPATGIPMSEIREQDVLCGRGGLSNKHSGNKMFRHIVHENKQLYQQCESNTKKQFLVESIIRAIQQHGGRFLRRKDGTWNEISHREACVKTSQALREQDSNLTTSIANAAIRTAAAKPVTASSPAATTTIITTPARATTAAAPSTPSHKKQSRHIRRVSDGTDFAQWESVPANNDLFAESTEGAPVLVEADMHEILGNLFDDSNLVLDYENDGGSDDFHPLNVDESAFVDREEYADLCGGLIDHLVSM